MHMDENCLFVMLSLFSNILLHHILNIILHLLYSFKFQEGEEVEFNVREEGNGRRSAESVTGPDGSFVKGAPRRTNSYDDFNRNGY